MSDSARDAHHFCNELGAGTPPFAVRFCPEPNSRNWAAVADEEGNVSLIDTSKSSDSQSGRDRGSRLPASCAASDRCALPPQALASA